MFGSQNKNQVTTITTFCESAKYFVVNSASPGRVATFTRFSGLGPCRYKGQVTARWKPLARGTGHPPPPPPPPISSSLVVTNWTRASSLNPALEYCGGRNPGSPSPLVTYQRIPLSIMELVRLQPCQLCLLPGVLALTLRGWQEVKL